MNLSLFQIANLALILILLILVIRYLWVFYIFKDTTPVQWQMAVKRSGIAPALKQLMRNFPDKSRFFTWWFQIERLKRENVSGVFVELGVYKGQSASVIHKMDPTREFHLFDTFNGFPASDLRVETGEAATYTPSHFADTSISEVLKRVQGHDRIHIHQGHFPESASGFSRPVAFVNMDADLYMPTRAGLAFFYPLLEPGGVIMVHDYNDKWPGIVKAVDEFVAAIPENPVLLPDIDGTVLIIRNK